MRACIQFRLPRPVVAVGLITMVVLGCEDETGPDVVQVAGTWDAVITVVASDAAPPGAQFPAVLTLGQDEADITGMFTVPEGGSGTVTATISGRTLTFTLDQDDPCPGTFEGQATVAEGEQQIGGTYSGSSCSGDLETTFTATKR